MSRDVWLQSLNESILQSKLKTVILSKIVDEYRITFAVDWEWTYAKYSRVWENWVNLRNKTTQKKRDVETFDKDHKSKVPNKISLSIEV